MEGTSVWVKAPQAAQPCWKSVGRWAPGCRVVDHGVERHDELANARGHGHLERFAGLAQTVVKGSDHRIKTQRRYAGHVKCAPHDGAPALHAPLALMLAAVAIERCDAGEGGDLAAVERAELGHEGDQCGRGTGADTGHRAQQIL